MPTRPTFRTATLLPTLLGAALASGGTTVAAAQPLTGPYVSLGGGYNILQDLDADFHGLDSRFYPVRSDQTYRFTDGFDAEASVGYGLGNGVRIEVEGDDYGNSVNNRVHTFEPAYTTGATNMYGGMANVIYDIDLRRFGIAVPVTPYVGVGIGYQWLALSSVFTTVHFGGDGPGPVDRTGGTNGAFAYQGIVGAAYDIAPIPGLALTGEFRFLGTLREEQYTSTNYYPDQINDRAVSFNDNYNYSFMLGLRYAFNAAPPPPPPVPAAAAAPAPAPSRSYLVFFDWDRAFLTPRARQIVAEAARNSTRTQTTEIEVDGYADTSHALPGARGQQYNLHLSMRRADAVREALVADGVPANAISVHAFGDTNLLVPTGPDVREPQNRRVEIVLH